MPRVEIVVGYALTVPSILKTACLMNVSISMRDVQICYRETKTMHDQLKPTLLLDSEQKSQDALTPKEALPLPPINLLTIGAVMSAALWIGRYELERRLCG